MTTNLSSAELFPSLSEYIEDPNVAEIMVDTASHVYLERFRKPKYEDIASPYADNGQLMAEINAYAASIGQRVDMDNPILEGRLTDGARVHIVLPPVSPIGPLVNIRKIPAKPLTEEELIAFGAWTAPMITFLRAAVQSQLNIVISGGPASGVTTVLDILAAMGDHDERVINIGGEARLPHKHALILDARQADAAGQGKITYVDLMYAATRMRPDRIILTEAAGAEILPYLEAMNVGYNGSLMTLHASNVRDAISRLETMASMGNPSLPLLTIRELLASSVHLILHQQRMRDGVRRMLMISEIVGMQGDTVQVQDIFTFQQTGYENKRVQGYFSATGVIPRCMELIRDADIELPLSLFSPSQSG